MRSIKLLKTFIYLSILVLGIVVGISIGNYNNMSVSEEINLIDIATLIVTVFLAVYIPEVLDRRLQNTRDKKMLLENRISEFQALVKRTNMLVQSEDKMSVKDYLTMKNTLDVSQNKLETIISLIKHADLKTSFDKDLKELQKLSDAHSRLLTIDDDIAGEFLYPDSVKAEEEKIYNQLDKVSSVLIFRISDA